jgi:hypothetical protein
MTINVKSAIKAGIIAGIVFVMLEMVLAATVGGGSAWGPPRMIAAIAMGKGVLPPPATFDLTILMVAMAIHFVVAIILAIVFALIADAARWSLMTSAIAGLVFGILIYSVNFYGMTAVFPWFAMARGVIAIFAHTMFGLVLGFTYRSMTPLTKDTVVDRQAM